MKSLFLRRQVRWLLGVLIFPLLAACAATPGLSIIADLNDSRTIQERGFFNIPDDELRAMEERDLPSSTGISYDIDLIRRSLIQLLRGNLDGLRATRALAMKNGSNAHIVIDVRANSAFGERAYLNHRAALVEYAEIEKELICSPQIRGRWKSSVPINRFRDGVDVGVDRSRAIVLPLMNVGRRWRTPRPAASVPPEQLVMASCGGSPYSQKAAF